MELTVLVALITTTRQRKASQAPAAAPTRRKHLVLIAHKALQEPCASTRGHAP